MSDDGGAPGETLDEQALGDILNGACLLGCGGGGPYVVAEQLVQQLVELTKKGQPVRLAPPGEVPDDAYMAISVVAAGSDNAGTSGGPFPYPLVTSTYESLAGMLGRRFTHVLAAVVGAGNSIIPMFPAAMLQIPLVDAAGAPRAVPLLTQTSLADLPISPVVLSAGEATTISFTAASVAVAGPTLMALIESGIFPGFAAVAMWAMDGATMRAHAMPGTLSRAQAVGRAIREARTSGGDPVDAACRLLGGVVLFTGGILTASTSDSGVTTTSLSSGSSQLTIYSLNDENLIAWDNTHDTPLAIAPDLVCYLTTDGQPFSNATADIERFATGKQVAVIGVPAAAVGFASPAIVAAFSGVLASLGYSGPYVPIGRAS